MPSAALASDPTSLAALGDLSIEQLANLQVTSVFRRPVPLAEAPAAIYVITADQIRRSGARTLPDALRLAPNLDVVRLDAVSFAISARGFGGTASATNKMLVLIDGRSVYSPLFSGVFWHQNNVVLSDIERIEVISGPGGTLWGANAVNGVINIITKSAAQTQGLRAEAGFGNRDRNFMLQYGGELGENGSYRIYGMAFRRDHSLLPSGLDTNDRWEDVQGGFRFDWDGAEDNITLQGDIYNATVQRGDHNKGQNLIATWQHDFEGGSALQVRTYYDNTPSSGRGVTYAVKTYDASVKYTLPLGAHQIVVGGGFRSIQDYYSFTTATPPFVLVPPRRAVELGNFYAQDTVALTDALHLTFGTKFEYSSYTGPEFLPDVRLGWRVRDGDFLWAAVSRAARTASRFDRDFTIAPILLGGPSFDSEILTAYEAGYRTQPTANTSLSLSLFWDDYAKLRTVELTGGGLPLHIVNGAGGYNYGAELWGSYQATPWWRLNAGLTVLDGHFHTDPGHTDLTNLQTIGDNPNYWGSLRSQMQISSALNLDLSLRFVGARPMPAVPAYTEADASIGWQVSDDFSLQLSGINLLHASHPEGVLSGTAYEIGRAVFLEARWGM